MIDDLLLQFRASLGEEFIIGVEAQHFVAYCEANHPDELQHWLRHRSEAIVGEALRAMLHHERAVARRQAKARAFHDAVNDDDPAVFDSYYATNHRNLWKKLKNMTTDDLVFVADRYAANGRRNLLWASFFRVLSRKVGPGQTVADVFTEDQVVELQTRHLAGE